MSMTIPGIVVCVMENRSAHSSLCLTEVRDAIKDSADAKTLLKLDVAIEWLDVLARLGQAN